MPTVRSWARPHDQDRICRLIATTKEQAAMVIVAIHWGVPPHWLSPSQGLLATYQQPLAHALIDAGADVVWGHHAHVMHPIEIYQGHPIFYSLGNFFCEIPEQFMEFMQPEALIVRIAPLRREVVELVPLLLDQQGVPRRARGETALHVLQKARDLSAPYGAQVVIQDDRAYLQLS
jgi:poly-gamma-glutamate synthesis protein (capsule biosynthesis protein)